MDGVLILMNSSAQSKSKLSHRKCSHLQEELLLQVHKCKFNGHNSQEHKLEVLQFLDTICSMTKGQVVQVGSM